MVFIADISKAWLSWRRRADRVVSPRCGGSYGTAPSTGVASLYPPRPQRPLRAQNVRIVGLLDESPTHVNGRAVGAIGAGRSVSPTR